MKKTRKPCDILALVCNGWTWTNVAAKQPMMALVVEQLSSGKSWQNLERAWHQALLITWQGSWLDDSEDASAQSRNKVSGFVLDA
jgi:hypothetical protein